MTVEAVGLGFGTVTGEDGSYSIDVPDGIWKLRFSGRGYVTAGLANQHTGWPGTAHLFPVQVPADFQPLPQTFGVGHGTAGGGGESVQLPQMPWLVAVPAQLPSTIRVARYFSSSCSGSYQRIDTIDFEDYVRGVVYSEVGVFYNVAGGPDAAAECWKAFAIAARTYALHFILTNPGREYDINDTACNQRYTDDRNAAVSAAVDATRGMIMVKKSDPTVFDRYFYAASCAHHGTEPAYAQGTIIPDPTDVRACVGSWCGHDNCAGHADNPELPGSDKCLVWGMCQWGAVERSMSGHSFDEIIAHYQPNVSIITVGAQPQTGILKGVVYREPDLQDWIAGAEVTLEGGPTVVFDGQTPWQFELEPGTYTVYATAPGYNRGSKTRTVVAGEVVWGSVGLVPVEEGEPGVDEYGPEGGEEIDGGSEELPAPDSVADEMPDAGDEGQPAEEGNDEQAPEHDVLQDETTGGGCGCGAAGAGSERGALLLALLLMIRKRRR
ncbi:MAG: PEGA domain-containing protein [Deltaproteobacteria bacterium]|nr:MAG: PEGA domain-containing protein [Deltaproteobacteria bacterium]